MHLFFVEVVPFITPSLASDPYVDPNSKPFTAAIGELSFDNS